MTVVGIKLFFTCQLRLTVCRKKLGFILKLIHINNIYLMRWFYPYFYVFLLKSFLPKTFNADVCFSFTSQCVKAGHCTVCWWRWAPAGGPCGWRVDWHWAGECFSFPCGHSRYPRSYHGWIQRGCGTGRSAAPFLSSSARTSARPQTHEPGWKRQDDGLNK